MKLKIAVLVFIGITVLSFFQMGVIRKKEDPILKTQTEAISYKQKMEEIKDGEKGPSMPSFNLYPKQKFLSELPVDHNKDEQSN